jgi:hypothetical protein
LQAKTKITRIFTREGNMEKNFGQTGDPSTAAPSNAQEWQERLLPFMARMVLGLTLFFFVASCAQLVYLHWAIKNGPELVLRPSSFSHATQADAGDNQTLAAARLQALVDLEAFSLRRHTHQANVLLMARVWTRYLGFVTGMILALVGAAFILGKLQIAATEVNATVQMAELSVKSASPGLILAVLGVLLMLATIVTHHQIQTTDTAVFLKESTLSGTFDAERPPLPKRPQGN